LVFSLLFGVVFVPTNAQAGFWDLFSTEVSADIIDSISSTETIKNSQNMDLLQADVSFVLALRNDGNSEEAEIVYSNIVSENALIPDTNPMGIGGEVEIGDSYSDQISVYVVRPGDSISQIAEMYDVSVNTILWANDMKRTDTIKEGDILLILPVSGVEHTVIKGQTLDSIAKLYKVEISDIQELNGMREGDKLAVGDEIIIPGGEEGGSSSVSSPKINSSSTITINVPNPSGYFIHPVPASRRSRGITSSHRGVDFAAPTGTPIRASASGTVMLARGGYNGGYGNTVLILHPNGFQTLYAHMSRVVTHAGAQVSQGETIGYVGSTGRSTGPHLHFEVKGKKGIQNPGNTTPMSFTTQ